MISKSRDTLFRFLGARPHTWKRISVEETRVFLSHQSRQRANLSPLEAQYWTLLGSGDIRYTSLILLIACFTFLSQSSSTSHCLSALLYPITTIIPNVPFILIVF